MHGMLGKYSRVPMPPIWCSLCHVYTIKSEYKHCTERRGGVNRPILREVMFTIYLVLDSRVLKLTEGTGNVTCVRAWTAELSVVWVTPVGKEGQKAFALYLLILFWPPFQSHSSVCCHRIFRSFLQLLAVGFSGGICSCLLGFFCLNFSGMKECKKSPSRDQKAEIFLPYL